MNTSNKRQSSQYVPIQTPQLTRHQILLEAPRIGILVPLRLIYAVKSPSMHEPKSVCISGVGAQPDTTLPAKGNPDPGTPVGGLKNTAGGLTGLNMESLGLRATCGFWVALHYPLG